MRFMAKLFAGFILVLSMSLFGISASSANVYADDAPAACQAGGFFGFPAWYEYLDVTVDDQGGCDVQAIRYSDEEESLNLGATIGAVLLAIVEILLRVAGIVAVGFVIYGGVSYTLSQGAPEKTAASKNIILNGLIGLVIASLAVVIVNLVGNLVT